MFFEEKMRKEIGTVRQPVLITAVHYHYTKKLKAVPGTCHYCGESGHFKADCPTMVNDRGESRSGGALYRTDIWNPPSKKKAKGKKLVGVRTIKKPK